MEIKKKKEQKNLYIPLLVVLVLAALIVAVTTSARQSKREAQPSASSLSEGLPVAAKPVETEKKEKETAPPETESTVDTVETEPVPDETAPEQTQNAESTSLPVFASPVSGVVVKGFSDSVPVYSETMNDYRVHNGVDVACEFGDAVLAAADGTIGAIWYDPLMGNCMTVVHAGEAATTYMGLDETVPDGIAQGVTVTAGQTIGAVGDSALVECAEEPHLHFEMTISGAAVDPCMYVPFDAADEFEG